MLLCLSLICGLGSCKKYLDVKPDKKMVLPSTLADCQALLDNYIIMGISYPVGEPSADNYYLTFANWNTQSIVYRDGYIWNADADVPTFQWSATYQKVLYANQVLETLGKITPTIDEQATWSQIKGAALFFRSFSFYQAAQIWAKPFDSATSGTDLCIPLRLSPDISEKSERATVKQTYDRILEDLNEAVTLLPATRPTSIITKARPGQAAAHALLARVYLSMRDYPNAFTHADKCLQNYNTLIDFNTLNVNAFLPIAKYNSEVIFSAVSSATPTLNPFVAKVDSNLYKSYEDDDLRQVIFFRQNSGVDINTYQFRGSYDGSLSYTLFCGLATDEMYLVRAECYARAGNTSSAITDLNTLIRTRWATKKYTDMTATSAVDALTKILVERRKELLYRGLRWTDLRRLNKDPRFAVSLTRVLNGVTYTLPPNDSRYVLLIPQEVLKREVMPQNPR
nr:RagB/SusD family nutrient uptake outer membrane protein [Chitinophaga sp. CF118]